MAGCKVVAVAKDIGSHGVVAPVVELLDSRFKPEEIVIVVEGIAAERFQKAGRMLAFAGTRDFRDISFSLDCEAFLDYYTPNVVIIGEGGPINLERKMARAANDRSIPVVALNDFWGEVKMIVPAVPTVVCVLDEFDASVSGKVFPEVPMHIVGNPGARNLVSSKSIEEEMNVLSRQYDNLIVFVGSAEYTADDIALLVECLEITPGNWCLIPAFHPAIRDRRVLDAEITFDVLWRGILSPLGNEVKFVEGGGEDLVACATTVISHRSTLMTAAVFMGKRTICIQTPAGVADMQEGLSISVVPLVALGVVPSVERPTDLSVLGPPDPDIVRSKIFPYDPERVWDAVKDFF